MKCFKKIFAGIIFAGLMGVAVKYASAGDVSFAVDGPFGRTILDGRTESTNSDVRQIFVVGDSTGNTGVAPVSPTSGLAVEPRVNTVASYAASTASLVLLIPASATDICTITGSDTKTVKITNVVFIASQTTAGNINIALIKRSTANTGTVASTPTVVAMDSSNAAGTAVVRVYTSTPTVGTQLGYVAVRRLVIPAAATATQELYNQSFGNLSQPVVLRGSADVLAVDLLGQTVTGGSFGCGFMWTEE